MASQEKSLVFTLLCRGSLHGFKMLDLIRNEPGDRLRNRKPTRTRHEIINLHKGERPDLKETLG